MKNNSRALIVAGCLVLASTIGCGTKPKACKVAERTEAEVIAAWSEAALPEASEKRREWAAGLEAVRRSEQGPAETLQGFISMFRALGFIEEGQAKRLSNMNEDMKAGKPVAENTADMVVLLIGGPRDGKTPAERIQGYAPKIVENERQILAHKKAAAACRRAVEQLEKMG